MVGAGLVLDVSIVCDGESGTPRFDPAAAPFADFVTVFERRAGGARYVLDLVGWAGRSDSIDGAYRVGWSVVATASAWLLAPVTDEPMAIEVRITAVPDLGVVSAAMGHDGIARYDSESLPYAGFTVFGALADRLVNVPIEGSWPSFVEVVELDGALDLDRAAVDAWIVGRVAAAARLWGGPPAARLLVILVPVADSGGVFFGISRGGGGAGVALFLGQHTEEADLAADWVLAHELVHVGMPFLPGAYWVMEGAAVYLEPILRARAGLFDHDDAWRGFARHLDAGARRLASASLDTMGFPGLYLSGAAFMLALDVEARRASGGRVGLEHCLRAVRAAHGDSTGQLDVHALVAVCDEVFGDGLMSRFMARHAQAASPLDLAAILAGLGVAPGGGEAALDDTAPEAWIRHAIDQGVP